MYSALNSTGAVVSAFAATVLLFSAAHGKVNTLEIARTDLNKPAIKLPAAIGAKPEFTITKRPDSTRSGIDLAATMSAESGKIERPVDWTIFSETGGSGNWEKIEDVSLGAPKFDLKPGRYVVRLKYGNVRTSRLIDVAKDMVTEMTVNLNAGGLRMISRLFGQPLSNAQAEHLVYRIDRQGAAPELVGRTEHQGAILRLAAGKYKVVSTFGSANAVKEAVAHVRPGKLSALEFDHVAGVVTLIAPELEGNDAVHWVITDHAGSVVTITDTVQPSVILRAGSYTATATIGGVGTVRNFSLGPGEKLKVKLPRAGEKISPNDT
ncbi:MAG: hypothetical protein ACR2OR_15285 [Hyphomicrobiales bacterium]